MSPGERTEPGNTLAVARVVRLRRVKRRVKAALSIGLALCAGVFLMCVPREKDVEVREPPVPLPDPGDAPGDTGSAARARVPWPEPPEGGVDAAPAAKGAKDAAIDRAQHRKGMPVRDNLLE